MGAISRLVKLGVFPTDLADTLALSVGQRMIRRVCKHCSDEVRSSSFKESQPTLYCKYIDLIKDDNIKIRTDLKGV
nr:hypothetical protein [Abyssogena phaseoliformis symbiont]